MKQILQKSTTLLAFLASALMAGAQATNTYNSSGSWTVPTGVSSFSITVYGGAGGIGGLDCGAGCTNPAAGQVGLVEATYNVSPGDVVGIYPGGKGNDGLNSATAAGGGAGGADSYTGGNYNGGNGGNAGNAGSSGGGGGGGAASVVTINGTIIIVAGGAGGGGGMANLAGSGFPGNNTTSPSENTFGGNGTTPVGDGGGGAGGGGGQLGSIGGGTHAAGGEQAGNGGFRGNNAVAGFASLSTNSSTTWTNGGRISITYTNLLPVTLISFAGVPGHKQNLLTWATASEHNAVNFTILRSSNGVDWSPVGQVAAAGTSSFRKDYTFSDDKPLAGINYYRLAQKDIDGRLNYSKTITVQFSNTSGLLNVYPNPVTNGRLGVTITENSVISIFSNNGVKMLEKTLAAGKHDIDVSRFGKGNYFIKSKKQTEVFIIQ